MGTVHPDDNTLDPDLIPTIRFGAGAGADSGSGSSSSSSTIIETRRGPARIEPASGDVIGPWTLGRELGRGALSVVFEATHERDTGPVALKILTPAGQLSGRAATRFGVEAWVSRRLRHPGVARVYDDDFESIPPWIAMELLPGGTLADRLRHGPLEIVEAVRFMVCVAEAVARAHAAGIIHRDIKPGNILLTEDGQPVLADFGLAHTRVLSSYLGLSGSGDIIGTPGYMAPEQGEGRPERIDELSDVYALGATLYALLTGRPPFDGSTPAERLVQTVTAEVPSARSLRPEVPLELDRLIRRCLTVDKLARLESAAEFARIGRVWLGEQAPATPGAEGRLVRVAMSAMIAVTLLAVAAAGLGIWRARRSRRELVALRDRVERDLDRRAGATRSASGSGAADPGASDPGDGGALWLATKILPELGGSAAGDELADRLFRRLQAEDAAPGPFAARLARALIERETRLGEVRATRLARARELAERLRGEPPARSGGRGRRLALRRLAVLDGEALALSEAADRGERIWGAELALVAGDRDRAEALLGELEDGAAKDTGERLRRWNALAAELRRETPSARLRRILAASPGSPGRPLGRRARQLRLITLRRAVRAVRAASRDLRPGETSALSPELLERARRRCEELAAGLGAEDRALVQATRLSLGVGVDDGVPGDRFDTASPALLGRLVRLEARQSGARASSSEAPAELESLRALAPGLPWPELRGGELAAGASEDLGRLVDLVLRLAVGPPPANQ